jgi:hypothetical protein
MARWICPQCDREFARAHQSHTCVPGGSVEDSFAGRPDYQAQAYSRIMAHLASLGPVHTDSVKVGVFLKSDRKFAEIRPMARALSVYLLMSRPIDDARVSRTERVASDRFASFIRITDPDQVDDVLCGWLTEAYDDATELEA